MMELSYILDRAVSFEFGLITFLAQVPTQISEAPVHIFIAEFQDPAVLNNKVLGERIASSSRQASGAAMDREGALWATVGEAIERYCVSNWMHHLLLESAVDSLLGAMHFLQNSIYFSDIDYDNPQLKYARPDPKKPRDWIKGTSLVNGGPYHVPASFACMNYIATYPHEFLDRSYSTGLASHIRYDDAILSGLYEVIERDGYMSYWLTKSVPEVLCLDLVKSLIPTSLFEELFRLDLDLRFFALRTDIEVPIIVCCLKMNGGGIATGACCNLNVAEAATKAAVESMHTYNWCLDMKRARKAIESKLDLNDFHDHVCYYLDPERSESYLWWAKNPTILNELPEEWVMNTGSVEEKIGIVVSRLVHAGFEPAWLDMTSPDVADLGFVVIKAVVAGLHPLSSGYQSVHTDARRLTQFATYRNMNWDGKIDFDPPHAFP